MPRIFCLFILLSVILAGCEKRDVERKYRIGIVNPAKINAVVISGFKKGMEEAGYREGGNLEYLHDEDVLDSSRFETVLKGYAARKVDLVYTLTTRPTLAAKKILAGSGIPLLFAPVTCPYDSNIIKENGESAGFLTGVKVRGSTGKALEILQTICPKAKTIFVPFHESDHAACITVKDLQVDASRFGVKFILARVESSEDIEKVMSNIPAKADAVWLTCSSLILSNSNIIVNAARLKGLPVAASTARHNEGALISYGEDDYSVGRQASRIAVKILRGVPVSNIPVETSEYYLGINLKIARELKIDVPESVLKRADYIAR